MTLHCGPATAVDLRAVPRAIQESGFKASDLRITAHGRIDDALETFTPDGWLVGLSLAPDSVASDLAGPVSLTARVDGWDDPNTALILVDVRADPIR